MNDTYLKSKKILIVDDEECLRSMLITILEDENFLNIITADCVKTALEISQQEKPDIAILDVMLPDGNGFELYNYVHQNYPDIGFMLLTNDLRLSVCNKANEYGIPIEAKNSSVLIEKIAKQLNTGSLYEKQGRNP